MHKPTQKPTLNMEGEVKEGGRHVLDAEWVRPVLASIGLIMVLGAFELLSVLIAARWDADENIDWQVEAKRAA